MRLEDLGEYVAWLQLPPSGREGRVAVLPSVQSHVGAATINRKLSASSAFYAHQVRNGVDIGDLLTTLQPAGYRGGWKSFLHHIDPGRPRPRRTIALKVPKKLPRVLRTDEVQSILNACDRLRDRFLVALLYDSGNFSRGRPLRRRSDPRVCAAQRLVERTLVAATGVVQLPQRRVTGVVSWC